MGEGLTVFELHLHDGVSLGRSGGGGLADDEFEEFDDFDDFDDESSGPGFGVLLLVLVLILAAVAAAKLLGGDEADEDLAALDR